MLEDILLPVCSFLGIGLVPLLLLLILIFIIIKS